MTDMQVCIVEDVPHAVPRQVALGSLTKECFAVSSMKAGCWHTGRHLSMAGGASIVTRSGFVQQHASAQRSHVSGRMLERVVQHML